MADFIDAIKHRYKTGDVLIKLIFINILVFLLSKLQAYSLLYSKSAASTYWPTLPYPRTPLNV